MHFEPPQAINVTDRTIVALYHQADGRPAVHSVGWLYYDG